MKQIFVVFFIFLVNSPLFCDASGTWTNAGGGNWTDVSKWTSIPINNYPQGITGTTTFGPALQANDTINLGADIIINSISFDGTFTYTISGNSLSFAGDTPSIVVDNHLAVINSNITLQNNLNIYLINDLNIGITGFAGGVISGASGINLNDIRTLTLLGASDNSSFTGTTTVSSGILSLSKDALKIASGGNVTLSGGTLELNTADQTIDSLTFLSGTYIPNGLTLNLSNSTSDALIMTGGTTISSPISFTGASFGGVVFNISHAGTAIISGNINLGNTTRNFNISQGSNDTDMIVSGAISGVGGLSKTGLGTLELSGVSSNSYGGLTTLSSGTLYLNKTAAISVPNNVVINGGTLQLGQDNQIANTKMITMHSGTFDMNNKAQTLDSIDLFGGSVVQGGATLTLTGATTGAPLKMRGNTTISDGTIKLDTAVGPVHFYSINNGTAEIFSNISLGNLTRDFNIERGTADVDMRITGQILSGGVAKDGLGILDLLGVNTYSLGTSLNAGFLKIHSSNNIGTGNITFNGGDFIFESDSTLTLNNNIVLNNTANIEPNLGDLVLSGNISGNGGISQTGGDLRIIGSDKSYLGNTTVTDGILQINSNIPSTNVFVNSSLLQGNFTVHSITANAFGVVSPGNSIGVDYVTDLTFNSDSTYLVEVESTNSDQIIASGTVTINPGANLEIFTLGTALNPGFTYYIIDDTGGNPVVGEFSNISIDNPSIVGYVVYNLAGHNVLLRLYRGLFVNSVHDCNPGIVAAYLDTLNPDPRVDLDNLLNILVILKPTKMYDALDQLHPAYYKSFAITQEANAFNIKNIIQQRADEFYQACCIRNEHCKKKHTFWVEPYGAFLKQQDQMCLSGFDSNSIGAIAGSDCMLCNNLHLGLSGAYSFSNVSWHNHRGRGDIKSLYGNLYLSYFYKKFFINSSFLGSYNYYKGHRNIDFSIIHRKAYTSHGGYDLLTHLNTGFIFNLMNFLEFKPFISGDYLFLKENSFKEKGAESLNLVVNKSKYNTSRIECGGTLNKCISLWLHKVIPELKVSYIREQRTSGRYYTAKFADQENTFRPFGFKPNRNILSTGVGITSNFKDEVYSLRYVAEIAKGYSNQILNIEVIAAF